MGPITWAVHGCLGTPLGPLQAELYSNFSLPSEWWRWWRAWSNSSLTPGLGCVVGRGMTGEWKAAPWAPPCPRVSLTHQSTQPLEGSAQLKAMPLWWRLKCSQRNALCEQLTLMTRPFMHAKLQFSGIQQPWEYGMQHHNLGRQGPCCQAVLSVQSCKLFSATCN